MKKTIRLKVVFILFILGFVIVELGRVNIINTKALSPLGDTNENYEKIKEELGEGFSDFIKDNAPIKIYNESSRDIIVKAWDKEFTIREESDVISVAKNISDKIGVFLSEVKNKIDSIILG